MYATQEALNLYYTHYAKKGSKLIVWIILDFNFAYSWRNFLVLLQRLKRLLPLKGRQDERLCQHSL